MSTTRIKDRFQVTIPKEIRRQTGCKVGDLLDISLQEGRIVLTPQRLFTKPVVARLSDDARRLLSRVQEKMERITSDHVNSKGLTREEIEVAVKVGLIDPEESWWWGEDWQKEERQASKDIDEGQISEPAEGKKLISQINSILS